MGILQSRQEEIISIRGIFMLGKTIQCTTQGEYRNLFCFFYSLIIFFSSYSFIYIKYITVKQQYIPYINTITPTIVPTYSRILSTIEKVLQNLVTGYWSIGKSLQNLVEDQERNMAQLARIGAAVDQRWYLKKYPQSSNKKSEKEDRGDKEKSEKRPKESQEEVEKEIPSNTSCQNFVCILLLI